jgi:hypothetical protein
VERKRVRITCLPPSDFIEELTQLIGQHAQQASNDWMLTLETLRRKSSGSAHGCSQSASIRQSKHSTPESINASTPCNGTSHSAGNFIAPCKMVLAELIATTPGVELLISMRRQIDLYKSIRFSSRIENAANCFRIRTSLVCSIRTLQWSMTT